MPDEYTLKDGINYRADGYGFCNRCGQSQIANRLCLHCDVKPTSDDMKTADDIRKHCIDSRLGFSPVLAARIIAATRVPALHCGGCGKCLDDIRRENYMEARSHGVV